MFAIQKNIRHLSVLTIFLCLSLLFPAPVLALREDIAANLRGLDFIGRNDFASAVKEFSAAIRFAPDNAVYYDNRGSAYSGLGDYASALADLNKALQIKPGDESALMHRSGVYYRSGNDDKSLEDLNKVLENNPQNSNAFNVRGLLHLRNGRLNDALSDLNKAIKIRSNSEILYLNRSSIYIKLGNDAAAQNDIETALLVNPNSSGALTKRATLALTRGQFDTAISNASAALALDPKSEESHATRGRAWHAKGQLPKATADYEQALRLEPDRIDLEILLARARRGEGPTGLAASPAPESLPAPQIGEIRLEGDVQSVDAAQGTLTLNAVTFTLPNGKSARLAAPKPKIVRLDEKTAIRPFNGFTRVGALGDIKAGAAAFVVGKDSGSGQELVARWVGARQSELIKATVEIPAPTVAQGIVGRPTFVRRDGTSWQAGTAFLAKTDGGTLLISALHLLGPSGGSATSVAPEKADETLLEVRLTPFGDTKTLLTAKGALLREGFRFGERPGDYSGDLVAFRAEKEVPDAPILAPENAAPGDTIWIAGRATSEKVLQGGVLLYPARVEVSDGKHLIVKMQKNTPGRAFSGAPALNARGEVVGMMLGSSSGEGSVYFMLNPVSAIRERLNKASAPAP